MFLAVSMLHTQIFSEYLTAAATGQKGFLVFEYKMVDLCVYINVFSAVVHNVLSYFICHEQAGKTKLSLR